MSFETKSDSVVEKAREIAERSKTWGDFATELFDQRRGLVAKTFKDEMERQSFYQSKQYEEINLILNDLMKDHGTGLRPAPRPMEKSGRFNVRIPKSLHRSLEIEAKRENVSLNQLALTKLAIPLKESVSVDLAALVQAFGDVHEGYSADRIVVDMDYNGKFLRRCRELGLTASDFMLNHKLMNVRKDKKGRDKLGIVLPPTTKTTEFHDFDGYQFAAEIAIRVLQRTRGVSLDHTLCDPELAMEFDRIALQLVNETALKLRWAAFNLRKTHKLKPLDPNATHCDLVSAGAVKALDLSGLSNMPAVYVFYDRKRPVFAGETDNLKVRIEKHLRYGLPCVDVKCDDSLELVTSVIPNMPQTERVRWVMSFVNSERPLLNYQKAA